MTNQTIEEALAFLDCTKWASYTTNEIEDACKTIREALTNNPVRKHGKWIKIKDNNIGECDQCGSFGRAWMNYCFTCGSDMRSDNEEISDN